MAKAASTPPTWPSSPETSQRIVTPNRSRAGSRSIDIVNSPHTTFYTSAPKHAPLRRHAAMSILLRTAEGRERTLRALQHILRFYIYLKRRGSSSTSAAPRRTAWLLLLVFALATIRKLRNLSELITPFTYGSSYQRLSSFVGSADLSSKGGTTPLPDGSISSTRWLWTEKYAWAASDPTNSVAVGTPPASEASSMLLRNRLHGIETTLSLLDTIADGLALFARLGITIALPFKALAASGAAVSTKRMYLRKLFTRSERLADLFWLFSTLTAWAQAEWERREVWLFGKKVRRLMRDEEIERDRRLRGLERREAEEVTSDGEVQLLTTEDEVRMHRIRSQRRTLRDLRGRLSWLYWERLRLGADTVFAMYDVFDLSPGSEAVRAIAGAVSAGVGFSQIWSESIRLSRSTSKAY